METALAIYEALLQANVPSPAARRAAEALEKDMSGSLATKQDLQHLDQLMTTRLESLQNHMNARFEAVDARFDAMDVRFEAMGARFEAMNTRFEEVDDRFSELESRVGLMMQGLESRLVIKLGALMTLLVGLVGALQVLFR